MSMASPAEWSSTVQIRQRAPHRRIFSYMEQFIVRHNAAAGSVRIAEADLGLDFFFPTRRLAQQFVDFVATFVPIRHTLSKELASRDPDPSSGAYNYKFMFQVEICQICRNDLIVLPHKLYQALGNVGPLVLCTKVTNNMMTLMEPLTLHTVFLEIARYWRAPFKPFLSTHQLVEYTVCSIEADLPPTVTIDNCNYTLATTRVERVSDPGNILTVRTHLGHLLNPGDHVLGYDLRGRTDTDLEVVLINKGYEEKHCRSNTFTLGEEKRDLEYEDFLKDLEKNPEL